MNSWYAEKCIELQNSIELNKLAYKKHNFNKIKFPITFLRDIYTKSLPIENADIEQTNLFKRLNNQNRDKKSDEKVSFLNNVKILFETREDGINSFNSNAFAIINSMSNATSDATSHTTSQQSIFYTPNQTRGKSRIPETEISPFKLNENLVSEIGNDEERMNSVIFKKYYGYQNPSF